MYSWIWRKLPGSFLLKLVFASGLLALAVAMLFGLVFPLVDSLLIENPTVQ